MPKQIPAVTQALSDLLNVQTELKLAEAYGDKLCLKTPTCPKTA